MTATSRAAALFVAAALVVCASPASGDGAFPDAQAILLPAGQPDRIILATSFGLLTSDDAGGRFEYTCHDAVSEGGRLYGAVAAPGTRVLSVTASSVVHTDDLGCSYAAATGVGGGGYAFDVFPDPTLPSRVFAVVLPDAMGERVPMSVYVSDDAGSTFDRALFTAPITAFITGVESAASDPSVIYVTWFDTPKVHPRLSRTRDGGASWTTVDLEPFLGGAEARLAAVSRTDPDDVALRVISRDDEKRLIDRLSITRDGGLTFQSALTLVDEEMTAVLRRPNGDVWVTARAGMQPRGYRSRDGGRSFAAWALPLRVRGLAERAGVVYAATDDLLDGFALARSNDDGESWTPVLKFADIAAVASCRRDACAQACRMQSSYGTFPVQVCGAVADGGADAGASLDAASGVGGDSGVAVREAGGCSCGLASVRPDGWLLFVAVCVIVGRRRLLTRSARCAGVRASRRAREAVGSRGARASNPR